MTMTMTEQWINQINKNAKKWAKKSQKQEKPMSNKVNPFKKIWGIMRYEIKVVITPIELKTPVDEINDVEHPETLANQNNHADEAKTPLRSNFNLDEVKENLEFIFNQDYQFDEKQPEINNWDKSKVYKPNDVVSYENKSYKALIINCGLQPNKNHEIWDLIHPNSKNNYHQPKQGFMPNFDEILDAFLDFQKVIENPLQGVFDYWGANSGFEKESPDLHTQFLKSIIPLSELLLNIPVKNEVVGFIHKICFDIIQMFKTTEKIGVEKFISLIQNYFSKLDSTQLMGAARMVFDVIWRFIKNMFKPPAEMSYTVFC